MFEKIEFTILENGIILDLRPMYENKPPLHFQKGSWVTYNGNTNEILKAKPVDCESIKALTKASTPSSGLLQ